MSLHATALRPLATLALSALALAAAAADALPTPRHVVFCMTDDQGWGEVSHRDHPVLRTPELDAMAAAGLRFDRFYAASPVCSPTRAAALTGIHPERLAVHDWGYDLPASAVTIAELLQRAGHATGHFGKWHLGGLEPAPGKAGKHDRARLPVNELNGKPEQRGPGGQGFLRWISAPNFYDIADSHLLVDQGEPYAARDEDTAEVLVAEALAFIRQAVAAGRPSFSVIWFPSPHRPYQSLPRDRAPYADHRFADRLGELAAVDRAMGTLRAGLRELGIAADTLLWYTSDNGCAEDYPGGSGGLRGKKGDTWEGGIRVPGLIEWPAAIAAGRSTAVPAGVVDILPTLAGLHGIAVPTDQLDGVDLGPLLAGDDAPRPRPLTFGYQGHAAIIAGDHKLHRRKNGSLLLYDLAADPAETTDIAGDQGELRDRLAAQLDAWLARAAADSARFTGAASR